VLRRLTGVAFASYVAAVSGVANAQEPLPPPLPPVAPTAEPDPLGEWLSEVRAQRRAWEERRRAAKEAMDAHRRLVDPWGAAQREAQEQQTQRRREAFLKQIEHDREAFRNQAPWGWPQAPMPDDTLGLLPDDGSAAEKGVAPAPEKPLPGWDNRWYYHGY
jgi:hypothetical protein